VLLGKRTCPSGHERARMLQVADCELSVFFSALLEMALDGWDWVLSYWDAPRDSYIEFEALAKEVIACLSEQTPGESE